MKLTDYCFETGISLGDAKRVKKPSKYWFTIKRSGKVVWKKSKLYDAWVARMKDPKYQEIRAKMLEFDPEW